MSNRAAGRTMDGDREFPDDFLECVRFHGHLCPGLAIGYGAVKAARRTLGLATAEDEEVVAVVENDSCAVDAVQVLLGCTFGKGNLIFRDWGKQVFTFFDRTSGEAVRVSLRTKPFRGSEERRALRARITSGQATQSEKQTWEDLKKQAAMDLITAEPDTYFEVCRVDADAPPEASIVDTRPCSMCGEATVVTKMVDDRGRLVCKGCAPASL